MSKVATQAIVLRRVNHAESDRIVTLLTKDHGKVTVYAKGVRKPKSKLAGGIELCSLNDVSYVPSARDGGLATLTSARMNEHYGEIVKTYDVLQELFTYFRFIDKASEYEDSSDLFDLIVSLMRSLNSRNISIEISTLWFLVRVSILMGQGIDIQATVDHNDFRADAHYRFDIDGMGFAEDSNGVILPNDIKLLRLLSVASSPEKLTSVVGVHESVERLRHVKEALHIQIRQL